MKCAMDAATQSGNAKKSSARGVITRSSARRFGALPEDLGKANQGLSWVVPAGRWESKNGQRSINSLNGEFEAFHEQKAGFARSIF